MAGIGLGAGALGASALGDYLLSEKQKLGSLPTEQPKGSIPKDREVKETKENPPVIITGVSVPLDETRSITTAALAIDINGLNLKPEEVQKVTVICNEPNLVPKGVFNLENNEQVIAQLNKGIRDPSKVQRVDEVIAYPTGILYYPFVESNLTDFENDIKSLGIRTISPRNKLTGDAPGIPRDFYPQTMFEVAIESTSAIKTFTVGPYR